MSRTFGAVLPAAVAPMFSAPPCDAPVAHAPVAYEFEAVYAEHAAGVWRSLRALGVPPAHIDDAVQDVFIVVHQKLAGFHGPARIQTWLFAIARRVASHYRRAAGRGSRVESIEAAAAIAGTAATFEEASRHEAAALVVAILAELDDDKRELLVLVELEQVPVPEVATLLGVPLNTAYSRLRLARRAFAAALERGRPTRARGGGR